MEDLRSKYDPERTPKSLKEALDACNGNITNAAKMLGITRVTLWHWKKRHKEVADIIHESRMNLLDKCLTTAQVVALGLPIMENGKFVGWQEKPDPGMLKFFISTLGRDEGFGDSLDVTSAGDKIGGIQIEVIDSRDKVAKKEEEGEDENATTGGEDE